MKKGGWAVKELYKARRLRPLIKYALSQDIRFRDAPPEVNIVWEATKGKMGIGTKVIDYKEIMVPTKRKRLLSWLPFIKKKVIIPQSLQKRKRIIAHEIGHLEQPSWGPLEACLVFRDKKVCLWNELDAYKRAKVILQECDILDEGDIIFFDEIVSYMKEANPELFFACQKQLKEFCPKKEILETEFSLSSGEK